MTRLETIEYHISEDVEYFGHLEPFKSEGFPTNSIIFKTLPGFGATYWEIEYKKRNSIIIVPPVPAIVGKMKKHPKICGVFKKTTKEEVETYLKSDIYPKKIVTTPEGYIKKVKPIIEKRDSKFSLYKDFFMLFDECDRAVTDIKYRSKIIAPIDDFFEFVNKAMVSATAIIPSDGRFEEQKFKIIKIVPDYDYRKKLSLVSTNNIIGALKHTLEKAKSKQVFIFLNSTLTIKTVIDLVKIKEKSKVFCAEESVKLLRMLDVNTSSSLDGFAEINIFTSRFFSAVDIDLDFKPDVIMITDLYNASYSILDPMTDSIQISGRFRKPEGSRDKITLNSLTHITNYNPNIKSRDRNETISYLMGQYRVFNETSDKIKAETDEGAKKAYEQQLKSMDIKDFLKENGDIEPFMVDNEIHHQTVKGYYKDFNSLHAAYINSKYFDVFPETYIHPISDEDNMKYASAKTGMQITEAVCDLLVIYSKPFDHTTFIDFYPPQEIKKLSFKHSEIVDAFFLIGYEKMKALDFKMHLITKVVEKKKIELARFKKEMVDDIHKEFGEGNGESVISTTIKPRLKVIYIKHSFMEEPRATDLGNYYDIQRNTISNGVKNERVNVYDLLRKKIEKDDKSYS